MTDYAEELYRERKAIALADQLQAVGCDSEEAGWLSAEGWAAVAGLAGVHYPSPLTRELVVALLAQREEAARRMASMSPQLEGMG
ncbi:MAG TPA: hypothetical protein VGW38_00510 [Chloroflexota bacterium]|nr:hypothetical protein [Chloroflexota bacterium]